MATQEDFKPEDVTSGMWYTPFTPRIVLWLCYTACGIKCFKWTGATLLWTQLNLCNPALYW